MHQGSTTNDALFSSQGTRAEENTVFKTYFLYLMPFRHYQIVL